MAQARINDSGIRERHEKISRWETQISLWRATGEKSEGMEIVRKAMLAGRTSEEKEILSRVKSLSFSTEADRADLAKHAGILAAYDSIYYDIFDVEKKIASAETVIAHLRNEIEKAKKGELLEAGI